ncbi:MAG: type II secretion system protein [Bacilli bacterium]|nr:type II secretion system protein [Bacilli bacterium]
MFKLNNKGFSLVEVLAVVVILGVLAVVMVPAVTNIINQNKEDNLNNLKKSILSAAKTYISDNRYNITLDNSTCDSTNTSRGISKIGDNILNDNKLFISKISDYLSSTKIINPKDNSELNIENSYVIIKYDCNSRDYIFDIKDNYLVWN